MSLKDELDDSGPQAPIITIVGFPGAGKTSLAGLFPNPIFIQAENAKTVFETSDVKPKFLKQLRKADKKTGHRPSIEIMDKLRMLIQEEHDYKTVIIDSNTALNDLFEEEVVVFDDGNKPCDSIGNAAGGFHKGYDVSMGMHSNLIRACEFLRGKGMAVVFLSHTGIHKVKTSPEEMSEYSTYSLAMHERSKKLYVSRSDAVIYLKEERYLTGAESNNKGQQTKAARVTTSGDRYLITSSDGTTGYVDAKNRYNMPQEIKLVKGENPLLQYIPFFNQPTTKPQ
jgi:hypothetical protein